MKKTTPLKPWSNYVRLLRNTYPDPRTENSSSSGYCVGGAVSLDLARYLPENLHECFPSADRLERILCVLKPELFDHPRLKQRAQDLIEANDREDFPKAWKILENILNWEPPRATITAQLERHAQPIGDQQPAPALPAEPAVLDGRRKKPWSTPDFMSAWGPWWTTKGYKHGPREPNRREEANARIEFEQRGVRLRWWHQMRQGGETAGPA